MAAATICLAVSSTDFVPYTGATTTVDLGTNQLIAGSSVINGRTLVLTTGIPVAGEPNEIIWNVTGSPLLVGNNYALRTSANYESNQNNSTWRLGSLLGVFTTTSGNTGSLGYAYGVYGVAYKDGGGINLRNYGAHFIASNRSATGSITNNAAATFQTELLNSSTTTTNFGVYIHTPSISGSPTLTTNYGLYIESQNNIGTTKYALYQEGASDNSRLEGNLIVDGTTSVAGAVISSTSTQSPLLIGGSLISSQITYRSTTGNGTAAGTAHLFTGGNNGATTLLTMLNNGNIIIPNNRSILLADSSGGGNSTFINWSSGDNLTIQARQGVSDITINPTTTNKGMSIKPQGRVGIFGVPSPTAYVHIGAGAAGSANAPLKFTISGAALQTTAEAGTVEVDTAGALYYTPVAVSRKTVLLSTFTEGLNIELGTTTGTKIGTATNQKIGFYNATPVIQQTTAISPDSFTAISGSPVQSLDTFGGYTIGQIVAALKVYGILA